MASIIKTRPTLRDKKALYLTPVKIFALCVSRGFEKFATVSSSIRQHSPRLIERRRKGALLLLLLLVASSWDPPPLPPALSPLKEKLRVWTFGARGMNSGGGGGARPLAFAFALVRNSTTLQTDPGSGQVFLACFCS